MTAKAARYGSRSPASGRIPAAAEASCRTRAPTAIPSPVASCALVLVYLILPVLIDRFSKRVPPEDRGAHSRDVGHHAPHGDTPTQEVPA